MSKTVKILSVGRLSYLPSLELQKLVSEEVRNKKLPDSLIAVEHNPVYTVGIREKIYTSEEEAKLVKLGAEFYRTNRGGLITFHGPGQLVVYPILDLRNFRPSIRWYVETLEKTIIDLCQSYGINAYTSPYTGVWVDDKKICALGIHASRYITTHGLALNCNTDLTWFSHIVPCGIEGKTVTSLSQQLKRDINISDALTRFRASFSKLFDCTIEEFSSSKTNEFLNKVSTK